MLDSGIKQSEEREAKDCKNISLSCFHKNCETCSKYEKDNNMKYKEEEVEDLCCDVKDLCIYIAGPMTGIENHNRDQFNATETKLKKEPAPDLRCAFDE